MTRLVPASALAGFSGAGRLQDAMATFCRAWEARECRTVEVCNAAISACANQGNWAAAQEVRAGHERWAQERHCRSHVGSLPSVRHAGRAGSARRVGGIPCPALRRAPILPPPWHPQVVAMMQQEGIPPDSITFNSLLKAAAAAGLLEEAQRLYADMLQRRLRPTTFTYVGLLKAAANARAGDAAWLLQVRPFGPLVTAPAQAASGGPGAPRLQIHAEECLPSPPRPRTARFSRFCLPVPATSPCCTHAAPTFADLPAPWRARAADV